MHHHYHVHIRGYTHSHQPWLMYNYGAAFNVSSNFMEMIALLPFHSRKTFTTASDKQNKTFPKNIEECLTSECCCCYLRLDFYWAYVLLNGLWLNSRVIAKYSTLLCWCVWYRMHLELARMLDILCLNKTATLCEICQHQIFERCIRI